MPANNVVTIPVKNASCVSTNKTTNNAAAAKGIAKFQNIGSFRGAEVIRPAIASLRVNPTRIKTVCTTMADPTKANERLVVSDSGVVLLRCSVNFQTAQYTANTISTSPIK